MLDFRYNAILLAVCIALLAAGMALRSRMKGSVPYLLILAGAIGGMVFLNLTLIAYLHA